MRQDSREWSRSLALSLLLAPRSPVSEAFRSLRTQVQSKLPPGPATVSITSPGPGEGVTTTSFNLALGFAQAGQRVLLIEADFRHPAVGELLGVRREPGLADYILGSCRLDDAIRGVADFVTGNLTLDDVLLAPGMDHLHVMPCGQQTANVSELLGSAAFRSILPTLQEKYDVILFDSPPVTTSADATILARHAQTLLVFDPRHSETSDLRDAISRIRNANGTLLGFFVNGVEVDEQPAAAPAPS